MQSDDQHLRGPDHKIGPGVSQEAERILEDLVSLRPLHHSAPTGLQSHCLLSQDCYSLIELLSFEGRKSFKIFFYLCFSESKVVCVGVSVSVATLHQYQIQSYETINNVLSDRGAYSKTCHLLKNRK